MDFIAEAREHIIRRYGRDTLNLRHVLFVADTTVLLSRKLGADTEIVELAALFHDIDYSIGKKNHTEDSAKYAFIWLKKHGYPSARAKRICEAIMCHTTAIIEKMKNPSIEGRILFDADKMWALTPLGHFRCISHNHDKPFDSVYKKLERSLTKYDSLHFDESRKLIKRHRDICAKFLSAL
jgi:putative nucleotidyltransferase with HDIG domain